MSTFFKLAKPEMWKYGGKRSDTEKILQLNNGSQVLWMHLNDPESVNVLRGLEINGFFLDQAEEIDVECYDTLTARLGRWDKVEIPDAVLAQVGGADNWQWRNPVTGDLQAPPYGRQKEVHRGQCAVRCDLQQQSSLVASLVPPLQ